MLNCSGVGWVSFQNLRQLSRIGLICIVSTAVSNQRLFRRVMDGAVIFYLIKLNYYI